jgi:hypothetical protein
MRSAPLIPAIRQKSQETAGKFPYFLKYSCFVPDAGHGSGG